MKNTLAYYKTELITAVERFYCESLGKVNGVQVRNVAKK
jgi:hypothetical protein